MGSTKIIHVLKNDDFDEVFDLFKNTEAEEVIFIFPKGSRFAKQEQYFEAIAREAESSGKKASIMSTDPIIRRFASAQNIDLLEITNSKKHQPAQINTLNPESLNQENETQEEMPAPDASLAEEQEYDEEPKANLALAKTREQSTGGKQIKDILKIMPDHPIKIKEDRSNTFELDIKKATQETSRFGGDITKVWAQRDQGEVQNETHSKKSKSSRTLKKTLMLLAGGLVLVLIFILYNTLGNAKITIVPQKQKLDFNIKSSASSLATSVDTSLNRIPGQYFGYKDEESGTFDATGQKDVAQKAKGEITIYNKSSASQRLVATTRFKSPDGLIFRIPQTITVPAATKSGTTLSEGSIKSTVYADRPGPEYNIAPANFTIPGFEGTPRSGDFYAKSDKAMAGGIIGPSKVVTEEDFTKAQEAVTAKLKEKILQSLKDQAGDLKILDSVVIKYDPPITNAKVGDAAENLQITIQGEASTLAFRETDALGLVKNYVSQKGNVELLEKNLTLNYLNPQNNADNSIMTFDIQVTGQSAAKIDQDKISKDISGMNENAIRDYFKSIKEIESARITLSPFWVRSIPKNPGKVKLVIEKE